MDSNKTAGEEARRQLHRNAASYREQVLAATPHKTQPVRPPASYHENYSSKTNQTCTTLLEKQGRTHQWCAPMDPAYGQAKAGRPAQTYIQQLCEDMDVALKTCQKRWMIGRSGERGSGISVLAARHDEDDDDEDDILLSTCFCVSYLSAMNL